MPLKGLKMSGNFRFKSKQDARNRAKKFHLCTACLFSGPDIWKLCPNCQATDANRQFCMSKAELLRAAELIQAQVHGQIRGLKFQPKFDLMVNGHKVARYIADFEYELNDINSQMWQRTVEDVKPSGGFMEKEAKLKIDLFNAIHAPMGLKILITRRG